MKTKIIIALIIIVLLILSAFAVKRHFDNSVVDKYGMVYSEEASGKDSCSSSEES